MSLLYLIRHGQASFGDEDYDRLSPKGVRQAEVIGEYFRTTGISFDAVYSGQMNRQIDTATAAMASSQQKGDSPKIELLPQFNEYDSKTIITTCAPDMMREDPDINQAFSNFFNDNRAFERVFRRAMTRWISGRVDIAEVETWREFQIRVRRGVDVIRLRHRGSKRVAVFSSGGAISAATQMALGLSDEMTIQLGLTLVNASISVFKYDDSRFTLSCFNSVTHLEMNEDPELVTYK